jgi:glycosyltransferase involved in cell wall biosynthesis
MATLSVLMTNYNHGKYLSEALEAILNQSFKPKEIIIVDDASTDDSVRIIEGFVEKYPNLQLLTNDKNMGTLYSINRALKMASGDYVYSAAADDKILPGFFEKSMGLLEKYPQAGLCFSEPLYYDESKDTYFKETLNISDRPCFLSSQNMATLLRHKYFLLAGHSSIIKRGSLLKAGGYIPELKWHCDWFASYVVAFREGICYLPENLAYLRLSSRSYSSFAKRSGKSQQEIIRVIMDKLKSPLYEDVYDAFRDSGILSIYGIGLFKLMYKYPLYRDFYSNRIFGYMVKEVLKPFAPSGLKNIFRNVRNRYRSGPGWRDLSEEVKNGNF